MQTFLVAAPSSFLRTHQVFEEDLYLFSFVAESASHPLPHLHGGADDPAPHDGAEILHHHPAVDFSHQQLRDKHTKRRVVPSRSNLQVAL